MKTIDKAVVIDFSKNERDKKKANGKRIMRRKLHNLLVKASVELVIGFEIAFLFTQALFGHAILWMAALMGVGAIYIYIFIAVNEPGNILQMLGYMDEYGNIIPEEDRDIAYSEYCKRKEASKKRNYRKHLYGYSSRYENKR